MFLVDKAAASCCDLSCLVDAISKIAATVGVLGGGFWAVFLYFQARKSEGRTAALAAKQPFLSKRLELYSEATSCAAVIAVGKDETRITMATEKFWKLYWGPMALVEDSRVESAMVEFGKALTKPESSDQLKDLAIHLAHSCRDSLAESWHVVLSDSNVKVKLESI